jgi:hypothetical protein
VKPSTRLIYDRLMAAHNDRDLGWVSGNDLAAVGSWRYGGRIHELRHQYGYTIEKRYVRGRVPMYRLIHEQMQQTMELAS